MDNKNKQIVSINNTLVNFERQIAIGEKLLCLITESNNIFYEDSSRGQIARTEWFNSLDEKWKHLLGVTNVHTDTELLHILTEMTKLDLNFESDKFDISPLQNLTKLVDLELYSRNEYDIDITPLQSLRNLIRLSLYNAQIIDVSPLKSLINLTELELSYNKIIDITPLKGLTNLIKLKLT
jgi:Leucine-rich repeat (LRR) protein